MATYHVIPAGGGDATTVAGGIALLSGGDTLLIHTGTYNSRYNNTIPSGSSGNPTILRAFGDGPVTLRGTGEIFILNFEPASWITIDGIILDGVSMDSSTQSVPLKFNSTSNHIRFINGEIKNLPDGWAVNAQSTTSFIEVSHTTVHDSYPNCTSILAGGTGCGQSICWGYPFYWSGNNGLLDHVEIYNAPSFGIHMYSLGGAGIHPSNNVVSNCKIHSLGNRYWSTPPPGAIGPGDSRGTGILLSVGTDNLALNNIIYNVPTGVSAGLGSVRSTFYNNTIDNCDTGIGTGNPSDSPVFINNIVRNSVVVNIIDDGAATPTFSNNLCYGTGGTDHAAVTGDPLFSGAGDFHLTLGSAAINAGTDLFSAGVTSDIDGTARPFGVAFDIGAYEFFGVSEPTAARAYGIIIT